MSDQTLNRFLGEGDAVAMAAFIPDPPTPASGPDPLYLFFNTDDNTLYYWDGANWTGVTTAGSDVNPMWFDYRLSGSTGVAVTTTDVTAIATLYLTPYIGKRLSLYTSSTWTLYEQGEKSLALTGLIVGVCYDIFAYDSGGTVTLEALAWKKVTAGNSPTAGSSKVINLTDTATLVVGMDVTVRDGSASEISRITAVVSNTSITVDTLANSYTTPDVYGYRARATALTTQDGILVKNGETNKRYCGTICITATTGQTEDSAENRFIWNYYNRVPRSLAKVDTTTSWSYSTAAFRQSNASKANQVVAVCGVLEDAVRVHATGASQTSGATPRTRVTAVGLNRTATKDSAVAVHIHAANPIAGVSYGIYDAPPAVIGRNYYAWLEYGGGADAQTWYGEAIASVIQCGLSGSCRA